MIQLWEIPAEVFLRQEWLGLLPLVTLTRDGKQPEVVNEMIDQLAEAQEYDLLAIARLLGGLAFKQGSDESDWKLVHAQTFEEAKKIFFDLDKSDKKH